MPLLTHVDQPRLPDIIDTRFYFRPLAHELTTLLHSLSGDAWHAPTIAGAWQVRDIVAHLIDTALRRLASQRDDYTPTRIEGLPDPSADLVGFINTLNRHWTMAARRLSPSLLTSLYDFSTGQLAEFFESSALDAPAHFPVTWSGVADDHAWLDIGRDFTEQWHHQMQIRDAVEAAPLSNPDWLRAVIHLAVRALPRAYSNVDAARDDTVAVTVTGSGGGSWVLRRDAPRWTLAAGSHDRATASVEMTDDTAWRLFFNGLTPDTARARLRYAGDVRLIDPLLSARSVIV